MGILPVVISVGFPYVTRVGFPWGFPVDGFPTGPSIVGPLGFAVVGSLVWTCGYSVAFPSVTVAVSLVVECFSAYLTVVSTLVVAFSVDSGVVRIDVRSGVFVVDTVVVSGIGLVAISVEKGSSPIQKSYKLSVCEG